MGLEQAEHTSTVQRLGCVKRRSLKAGSLLFALAVAGYLVAIAFNEPDIDMETAKGMCRAAQHSITLPK